MKPFKFSISVACALLVLLLSAPAQTTRRIRVGVPHDFTIGDQQLPAGDYRVNVFYDSIVQVARIGGAMVATAVTTPVSGQKMDQSPRLVFHCYGTHCFLSEVWTGDASIGRELYASSGRSGLRQPDQTGSDRSGSYTFTRQVNVASPLQRKPGVVRAFACLRLRSGWQKCVRSQTSPSIDITV
jgi:hypothetical protein